MKITKKILATVLTVVMLFSVAPLSGFVGLEWGSLLPKVSALETSGECGDNVTWMFDEETGTLTISGTGDMKDYYDNAPWKNYDVKRAVIEDGVTSIGEDSFYHCESLTSITIPNSVTKIGECSLNGCSSLTSITVDKDNQYYTSENGVLFSKGKTTLIIYPKAKNDEIYVIPSSVKNISNDAFNGCTSLTSIIIPDSVTDIKYFAFSECVSLTSINVDKNNQYYTSENGVLFDKEKTELIQYPAGKKDKAYIVPDGVTGITFGAFSYCEEITSVTIPNSVNIIWDSAFRGCIALTNITISENIETIPFGCFNGCKSLQSVSIPNGVFLIEERAFLYCDSLAIVKMSNSVRNIEATAFYGCDKLSDVYYSGSQTEWNNINMNNSNFCLKKATIHYNYVYGDPILAELKDDKTGITVNADDNALFSNGTKLIGNDITSTASKTDIDNVKSAIKVMGEKDDFLKLYDISLELDGAKIQPNGKVTVKLPIPQLSQGQKAENLKVVYINSKGVAQEMATKAIDGFLVFETDHFSLYAVVYGEKAENGKLGDVNGDGKINTKDAKVILRVSAKLESITDAQQKLADVNKDGKVNTKDAKEILRYSAKLSSVLG